MTNARQAGRFRWCGHWRPPKSKTPELLLARAVYFDISLTMSYFHTGTRTIIGAEAFHFPVRDGKEWDHLAMVIRLNWLPGRHATAKPNHGIRIGIMTATTEANHVL
jgi:hypothetical protein